MANNAYIHIPFCKQKCFYCSFVSYPSIELKKNYINALTSEIKYYYNNEKLNTLYIGGGTPSLLEINEIQEILNVFNINNATETTIEINPENISYKYLDSLVQIGINRLSIGCQTFDNDILKNIGRKHTDNEVINVVSDAKKAGFKNISLDFIYGLPNQSVESFTNDLQKAISLGIQHISLYGLKIDEKCYFYTNKPENLPDDDLQANMYLNATEFLKKNNFIHYEISNFSLNGFESRHNLNYWNNNTYYGFGTAANGYIDNIRYSNNKNLNEYIINPTKHEEEILVSDKEKLEEEIFLGFRRAFGINTNIINQKYNINFEEKYKNIILKYLDTGHLEKTADGYKLTVSGILMSNYILADFI